MDRLTRRREFLKASNAPSWKTHSVIVQARRRGDETPARTGFTVTKKLGNAVARNRIRRRLKEAVRHICPDRFEPGTDYVFIGRQMARDRSFNLLMEDIDQALKHLNKGQSNHKFPRRIAK
ncbi:MAG: ribonuclease P protein component [Hyphomicrobiales bacterium]|nr:ribonuclease P protein component [Hyphomicrobiales bacterium]